MNESCKWVMWFVTMGRMWVSYVNECILIYVAHMWMSHSTEVCEWVIWVSAYLFSSPVWMSHVSESREGVMWMSQVNVYMKSHIYGTYICHIYMARHIYGTAYISIESLDIWVKYMRQVNIYMESHIYGTAHTYERGLSRVWMSQITHTRAMGNDGSRWSHTWMSTSLIWASHVTSHLWMSHVRCINESCHTYECIMSHTHRSYG